MKLLLTGAAGQLGSELVRTKPAGVELRACTRAELDVANGRAVLEEIGRFRPEVVINAAAYTAVDAAESNQEQAFAVNAQGAENLARAAHATGAYLVHVSTDFVFDGAQSRPYATDAATHPLGVYGASKLDGERKVLELAPESAVVRTSWLYAATGKNFVHTMLRLLGRDGRVRVVSDQVGTPTWARGLAEALWQSVTGPRLRGVHHFSDAGVASWYDFALAIAEEAAALGLLREPLEVLPIRTEDYPTPARRPPYSVLDKTRTWTALAWQPSHWRVQLRRMLAGLGS